MLRTVASISLKMVQIEMNTAKGTEVVTKEEFEGPAAELESWLKDPTLFWMVLSILTVGRA
jgi:hypothetical protein